MENKEKAVAVSEKMIGMAIAYKETRKQKPNQEVQRERLGTPFSREQTIFIERDEKSSIEEWKKREKEDVLKMRDFRKERKPEIKIHTKEVRKKTF